MKVEHQFILEGNVLFTYKREVSTEDLVATHEDAVRYYTMRLADAANATLHRHDLTASSIEVRSYRL